MVNTASNESATLGSIYLYELTGLVAGPLAALETLLSVRFSPVLERVLAVLLDLGRLAAVASLA